MDIMGLRLLPSLHEQLIPLKFSVVLICAAIANLYLLVQALVYLGQTSPAFRMSFCILWYQNSGHSSCLLTWVAIIRINPASKHVFNMVEHGHTTAHNVRERIANVWLYKLDLNRSTGQVAISLRRLKALILFESYHIRKWRVLV